MQLPVPDEKRLASPLEGDTFSFRDAAQLYFNLCQSQNISTSTHGGN